MILIFIRFIINLDVIRRKCDCQRKRQAIVIVDLLLFILVNTSLLRDSSKNPIRIVRKIILGILSLQLNNLLCDKTFWIIFIKSNDQQKRMMDTLHTIIYLRWILSSSIICFYVFSTLQSMTINPNDSLFSMDQIIISLNAHRYDAVMCMIILYIIHWDTLKNRNTLNRMGISCFCIGFNLLPKIKTIETPIPPQIIPTTTVVENNNLTPDVPDSSIAKNVSQEPVSFFEEKQPQHGLILFNLAKYYSQ